MHTDRDGARSFARWVREGPEDSVGSWWLLFPRHSVAIRLEHGVWVSWNGNVAPHCSAVPRVAEGSALLSLFVSVPADVCSVYARMAELWDALRARAVPCERVARPHPGFFDLPRGPLARQSGCRLGVRMGQGMRTVHAEGDHVRVRTCLPVPPELRERKAAKRKWVDTHSHYAEGVVVRVDAAGVSVRVGTGRFTEGDHEWAQNNVVKL